jgi:hypothetical protein
MRTTCKLSYPIDGDSTEGSTLPWLPEDAYRHTHKADTAHLCRLWAEAANSVLDETRNEAYAVRAANAAVRHALESDSLSPEESEDGD